MTVTTLGNPVSAANANRNVSPILRQVRGGASYVVTAHCKPVARIIPYGPADTARAAARSALLQRKQDKHAAAPASSVSVL